jgi:hypothetical protein
VRQWLSSSSADTTEGDGMSDEPKKRSRAWIGWALLVVALSGCSLSNEAHEALLPDPDKITSMRTQWGSDDVSEVHDHFAQIINGLKPNRVDPHPARWVVLGSLNIETPSGRTGIFLFYVDDEKLAFKIGDTYYLGGSKSKIDKAMAAVSPKTKRR